MVYPMIPIKAVPHPHVHVVSDPLVRFSLYQAAAERANAIRDLIIAASKQNNACCVFFLHAKHNRHSGRQTTIASLSLSPSLYISLGLSVAFSLT